jgi:hypothetical protein
MGLIKTVMLSGVALYGVHEISKAAQTHQSHQQSQRYTTNSQGQYYQGPPPPPQQSRHGYYPQQRGSSPYAPQSRDLTASDEDLAQAQDRSCLSADEKRRPQQRALSAGPTGQGSNADYYGDNSRPLSGSYQDSEYSEYAGAPPAYDSRMYGSRRQGGQGGFVEGEVFGGEYGGQQREVFGGSGGKGNELMEMLGSQLLGGKKGKGRKGRKEGGW